MVASAAHTVEAETGAKHDQRSENATDARTHDATALRIRARHTAVCAFLPLLFLSDPRPLCAVVCVLCLCVLLERKIVQKEAVEDIRDWQTFHFEAAKLRKEAAAATKKQQIATK